MSLIKHSNLTGPARNAVVLNLGDLAQQGRAIVDHARAQAEVIVSDARAERERILAGAREEGLALGVAKGEAEGAQRGILQGAETARKQHAEALARLEEGWAAGLDAFLAVRQSMLDSGRDELVGLAVKIAARVVKRALELDPSLVVDQVAAVLSLVLRPTRLQLRVNPEDRPLVQAALPGLARRFDAAGAGGGQIELLDDPALARGSCVARLAGGTVGDGAPSAAGGEIDASIATQLDRIGAALLPGPGPTATGAP